jgi:hypothetical protein
MMSTTTRPADLEPAPEQQAEAQGKKPPAATDLFGFSRDFKPSGFPPLTPEQQRIFARELAETFPVLALLAPAEPPPAPREPQVDAARADDLEAAGRLLQELGRERLRAIRDAISAVLQAAAAQTVTAAEPPPASRGRSRGNGKVRRRTKAERRKLH